MSYGGYVGSPQWKPAEPRKPTANEVTGIVLLMLSFACAGFALGAACYNAPPSAIITMFSISLVLYIFAHWFGNGKHN